MARSMSTRNSTSTTGCCRESCALVLLLQKRALIVSVSCLVVQYLHDLTLAQLFLVDSDVELLLPPELRAQTRSATHMHW